MQKDGLRSGPGDHHLHVCNERALDAVELTVQLLNVCRLMPIADELLGFRASFVLLVLGAAGAWCIHGTLLSAALRPKSADCACC